MAERRDGGNSGEGGPASIDNEARGASGADFPVVGLGASAGGLDAFKKFFSQMPADSGAAFILVPHLDPSHESLMVELISQRTQMRVLQAEDGMPVEPNCVYIIPPARFLIIDGGRLLLTMPSEDQRKRVAIDQFLRSLAAERGIRAIGIVLSGTGSHGSAGLKEIKLAGGLVMAQAPETAQFDQMPSSAIATGMVDFVLPPEDMPDALIRYMAHPYISSPIEQAAEIESQAFVDQILAVLQASARFDFRHYRKTMMIRRAMRRMSLKHIESTGDYIDYLRDHADEAAALQKDLLIGVTEFFRDPEAFRELEERVIPELASAAGSPIEHSQEAREDRFEQGLVRVWVPACATGEEAYSIAMLLLERLASCETPFDIRIFATDIDEQALEVARKGIYRDSSIVGISDERLQRFFSRYGVDRWQVKQSLRDTITFAPQNLISDAPFARLNLVSCRNLLIYLEPEIQAKVLRLFHFSLLDGGFLFLGPAESIGRELDLFEPVSKKWRVFRRLSTVRPGRIEMPIQSRSHFRAAARSGSQSRNLPAAGVRELMQRLILEEFTPAAVMVNRNHEVVSVLGALVDYLEFPAGEITTDLLSLARPGLRTRLRTALRTAARDGVEVVDEDARVKRGRSYWPCSIIVRPVADAEDSGLLLVIFEERERKAAEAYAERPETSDREGESRLVSELERELKTSRDDLQSVIEEYESSTEELKASNEEVMSMNEELQSANEELESSKEELQSLNEELSIVNSQLQEKVEALDRANDDLTNLIAASEVAIVFLSATMRINRFTPSAGKLLNLRQSDLDRPFTEIAPGILDAAMPEDCRSVLMERVPKEAEVWTADEAGDGKQRCFMRRIAPYLLADGEIGGLVITLVDITERIGAAVQARRSADVLMDSNDAVIVQDFEGAILTWNQGAVRMYGFSEAEAKRMSIRDLVPESRHGELDDCRRRVLRDEPIDTFETQRLTKGGRLLSIDLTVTPYRDEQGRPIGLATTERDISERKRLLGELRELNQTLEKRVADQTHEVSLLASAVAHLGEGVVITSNDLDWPGPRIVFVNEAMCSISGYSIEELIGESPRVLQGDGTEREVLGKVRSELAQGRMVEVELLNYRKDGTPYNAELTISPLADASGHRTNYVSIHRDITKRKQTENALREREERLRSILDTAIDAIITIDQSGVIQSVNAATERMFGFSQAELVGRNVKMIMPSPYRDEHDDYIARYLKTREARIIGTGRELVGQRRDGTEFSVDLSVSEVDGLHLFTGIVRDVSQRKALQRRVLDIAEEEQRRIGQDLHDVTGQELTGLGLFAGTLVDLLQKVPRRANEKDAAWRLGDSELIQIRQTAGRLAEGLIEANRHVRQLSHGIMPVQVEPDGLLNALGRLASDTDELPDIRCRLECLKPPPVSDRTIATNLYRIAQEAVNNALQHSRADQIVISLEWDRAHIVLEVRDNGTGFDARAVSQQQDSAADRGYGLEIMSHRAMLIGGRLNIEDSQPAGTTVRCIVPGDQGQS